jgi:hypothetical protein
MCGMPAVPSVSASAERDRVLYFVFRVTFLVAAVVVVVFSWKTFQSASANFPHPHSVWQHMRERFVDNRAVA